MQSSLEPGELPPLQPDERPPVDRFCDVVMDGGVINGVVYPGFLLELARKFRFHSIGGTSVGAIAACLAAACEYNRRFGSDNGFNEVLAKMPKELADYVDEKEKITKIRSLFQPHESVRRSFDWMVDVLGGRMLKLNEQASERREKSFEQQTPELVDAPKSSFLLFAFDFWTKSIKHLGPNPFQVCLWALLASCIVWGIDPSALALRLSLGAVLFFIFAFLVHPLLILICQIRALIRIDGIGMCSGIRAESNSHVGLMDWLYDGTQKAAGLDLHRPLTFQDLWRAPAGPSGQALRALGRSIDLRMITTCLSHGRIYELPISGNDGNLMFRLSEFSKYFPDAVVSHLRRVSTIVTVESSVVLQRKFYDRVTAAPERYAALRDLISARTTALNELFKRPESVEKGFLEPDIRLLPVGELPILVAARMSMSCPILFQNVPLLSFNLDRNAEDIGLVRLWFSDGGIGSNFPIHFFDQAVPDWPTFGMKILDEPPRLSTRGSVLRAYIPYWHRHGAFDTLLYPRDSSAFSNADTEQSSPAGWRVLVKYLFSIYTSAKDGHDQSYLRMPNVRNRVVLAYMNNRAGNMLNLKISPEMIIELAEKIGARGGANAAQAYLGDVQDPKYVGVDAWKDHRWIRLQMLIHGLRKYVRGFTESVRLNSLPGTPHALTLLDQIEQASVTAPLRSESNLDEVPMTQAQVDALMKSVKAIEDLEQALDKLDLPQPYIPAPDSELRFKPKV